MWFGKNIMTKLGLVLAMAVPALAADVWPLYFSDVGTTSQEDSLEQKRRWDDLMAFKIWGTHGISLGRVVASDSVGAVGTADGDLVYTFNAHKIGGPFYIGGNFDGGMGTDEILTGPVRVKKNFIVGQNDNKY